MLTSVALLAVACGTPSPAGSGSSDSAAIYAASLHQLVTEDNTFGGGGNPFTEFLVNTNQEPGEGGETRALTDEERSAVEAKLATLAPVRWIDDPEEWRTDDLIPVVEGSAILGVGPITFEEDGALVPMSMWCGGVCGTWFTYRLAVVEGEWAVTGIEGPIAVS